jgi:hypothetical protein
MIALFCLLLTLSVSPFKSKSRLEAENAALRHQLIVLQRSRSGKREPQQPSAASWRTGRTHGSSLNSKHRT